MAAVIITWMNDDLMGLRFVTDKGGCKLIFDDRSHAYLWVIDNDDRIDDFYKIVELGNQY